MEAKSDYRRAYIVRAVLHFNDVESVGSDLGGRVVSKTVGDTAIDGDLDVNA